MPCPTRGYILISVTSVDLGTQWQRLRLTLPPGPPGREVVLATDDCLSPRSLGQSDDGRCLSFQMRGMPLRRSELYDLDADPLACPSHRSS